MRFTLLFVLILAVPTYAQTDRVADLASVQGQVLIHRQGSPFQWMVGKEGKALLHGDEIKTEKESWAILQFLDGSTLHVGPRSNLVIRMRTNKNGFLLFLGRVVADITKRGRGIYVQTPTAVIAVLGTKFAVEVPTSNTTSVSVEEGSVLVSTVDDRDLKKAVTLNKGEHIVVTKGKALPMSPPIAKTPTPPPVVANTKKPQPQKTALLHRTWGIGIQVGEPTGFGGKWWLGRTSALTAALGWSLRDNTEINLHIDYLLHDFDLIKSTHGKTPLYLGIGGRVRFEKEERLGVRIPIGFNYISPTHPLDLFFELAPVVDLVPDTHIEVVGAFVVKYFFSYIPHTAYMSAPSAATRAALHPLH